MELYYADMVDADGVIHETVGENIRYGARGASDKWVDISVEFGANAAEEVTILANHTGLTDLVATPQSTFINFTSASHSVVNVVGVRLLEADGAISLAGMVTNSTGALAIGIVSSSAGDTAQFRVYVKVDEY